MANKNVINLLATGIISGGWFEVTIPNGLGTGYISKRISALGLAAAINDENRNDKGWFTTEAALNAAHPTGESGWYAIVDYTDTVWIWDTGTLAWVDSGNSGAVISVNGYTGTVVLAATDISLSSLQGLSASNVRDGIDELKVYVEGLIDGAGGYYMADVRTGAGVAITNPTTTITFDSAFVDNDYTPTIMQITGSELLDLDNMTLYSDRIEIPSTGSGTLNYVAIHNESTLNELLVEGTPAASTAPGVKGTMKYDSNYLYIWYDTNLVHRIAHSSW